MSGKIKVQECLKNIEKKFGRDHVTLLTTGERERNVKKSSSGLLSLDEILGGGLPHGRIIELYGQEGCGKTTLALQIIAEIQKKGGLALYIDSEHSMNVEYAVKIGVDGEKCYFVQPNSGEEIFDIIAEFMGSIDIIVLDSVAAITPKAEIEGESLENSIASQARLISKGLRKIINLEDNRNKNSEDDSTNSPIIIFINQFRTAINNGYMKQNITTGGRALRYYTSIRVEMTRIALIKNSNSEIIGAKIQVKTDKNRFAIPYRMCVLDLIYGTGFEKYGCILDVAVKYDIIKKSSSWYEYKGEKIAQGRDKAIDFLKKHPEIVDIVFEKNNV